jgi:hypothetical protein
MPSAMFSHDPPNGVNSGITPWANSHSTSSGVLCPARLSSTGSTRNGGSCSGSVIRSLNPACHRSHAAPAQDPQRPGRGAVGFGCWGAGHLSQDAILSGCAAGRLVPAAVARVEGGQPLAVEPGDQVGHRVAALATGRSGRLLVVGTVGDGQGQGGAGGAHRRGGVTAAQVDQLLAPIVGEGAERVLPAARHGDSSDGLHPRVVAIAIMATGEANDPLVDRHF